MVRTTCGVAVAAVACAATASRAQLIAYDGFGNGARANLAGSSGGAGWTSAWQDTGASIVTSVGGTGLTYPGLADVPGQATTGPGYLPDMTDYWRGFGAVSGPTLYVSVLMRPEASFGGWYIFRFGNYPYQCDLGVPMGYYSYGLTLGDGLIVPTNVPSATGQTALLVLEIAQDSAAGRTVYNLYVNPTVGAPQPSYPSATYARAGVMSLGTGVEVRGEGGVSFDELRVGTTWAGVLPTACYANCDQSAAAPVLNVADFTCFLQRFAMGDPYANCDGSTSSPELNVSDFTCFLQKFAAGCA